MDFNNNTIHSSSALMNLPELYSSANVNHLEKNSTSALNFSIDQILAASGTKQSNLSNSTANRCNSESSRLSPSTIIVQSPSECFNSPSTFSSKNGHFNQQQVLYPFYQSPLHYTFQPFLANYSSTINSNVANQQSMSIVTPGQQNFSQSSPLNASINQNQTKSGLQKVTPTLSNYLNVPSSYLKFGSILPVSTITGNSNAISEENLSASTLTSRNGKNKRPGNSSAEEMINEGGSKPNRRKRSWSRAVFSTHQRRCLEQQFISQIYINKSERRLLANSLNLSDAQVKVWFQVGKFSLINFNY